MKTIICPVDFTEVSDNAIDYACVFCQKLGGDLLLLHVIDENLEQRIVAGEGTYSTPGGHDRFVNNKLETLRTDIEKKYGFVVRTKIEYGKVDQVIPRLTTEHEGFLIVMGTSGAKRIREVFNGTNTIKVIEKTSCPVLIIPESAEFTLPQYWVFATDLQGGNQYNAQKIWELCSLFDAKLDLLHVQKEWNKKEMEVADSKILSDAVGEEKITFNKIKHSDTLKGINEYIGERDPDILALTQHQHKTWDWLFKEDKVSKVVENANFPILILHDQ